MDANWEHDHTVPSRTLYPHQWSWDSAFIAIGLAQVRPERAWRELASLFRAQWADGRVPHIVFNPALRVGAYFRGRRCGARQTPGAPTMATSGLVQPPVHALAALLAYRRAPGPTSLAALRRLYPGWSPNSAIWPTGGTWRVTGWSASCTRGSPVWTTVRPGTSRWQRSPPRRPSCARTVGTTPRTPTPRTAPPTWTTRVTWRSSPPTGTTAIPTGTWPATRSLSSARCSTPRSAPPNTPSPRSPRSSARTRPHRARATGSPRRSCAGCTTGQRHLPASRPAHQPTGQRPYRPRVDPLILPDLPTRQVDALVVEARSARFGVAPRMDRPLPTYDRTAPDFEPLRYWRGPSWLNIGWLVRLGLLAHGHPELAAGLRHSMIGLVARAGCHEYFHPDTGVGLGSPAFGWTAALVLDLLDD
ncbi:hypothetical protein NKG94_13860 [Micromonospora sp. M12]